LQASHKPVFQQVEVQNPPTIADVSQASEGFGAGFCLLFVHAVMANVCDSVLALTEYLWWLHRVA
jgi:hypothetical protein